MKFRLLGPLEVHLEGRSVPIRSGKHRALLAALLVRPNRSVPVTDLVDAIWGDVPPANPRNTVQVCVTRLRATLGGAIQTTHDGYQIAATASEIDLTWFETLVDRARGCAEQGDPKAEADTLREALALWRGEPLADVPSDSLHREVAPHLRERRLQALERRIDLDLRHDRPGELVSELVTLTAQHPLREQFWAQLMTALQVSGRRADALEAYQTVRRHLAEELGVDPGAALQDLHATILGRSAPVPPVPRQLPPDTRGFTGRAGELAQLDALVSGQAGAAPAGVVVIGAIAGTAGVGKTALAVHWARGMADHFPDGQLWVNLRGYDPGASVPPAQALTTFLRALGVPSAQIPLDLDGQSGLYRSILDGRRMLVVLDNANSPEQVRPLLPGEPGCLVVVTSRDDLAGLAARDGALRVRLDLLTLQESVALLCRLLGPAIVAADTAAVVELARLCAHLPLALCIAADWVALSGRGLSEVVAQLAGGSRLDAFAAGGDPHTAVREVISWSYRALPPDAAELFRLFGLVPGADWDAYAAAGVANCSLADARRRLEILIAAHLVDDRGNARYGMHDLLRAYATERADTVDTESTRHAALSRLLDYHLGTAAAAMDTAMPYERHLRPRVSTPATPIPPFATAADAMAWLDTERATIVALVTYAANHGWPTYAVRFAKTLYRYLVTRAMNAEAMTIHRHALRAAAQVRDRIGEAAALHSLGTTYWLLSRYHEALDHYQRALAIHREIDDRTGHAATMISLGAVNSVLGRGTDAFDNYQQALAITHEIGDQHQEARVLNNLGIAYVQRGRYAEALAHYERGLDIAREIGDLPNEANLLNGIAFVHKRHGRVREAFDDYERALTISREIGDRNFEVKSLGALGTIYLGWGRYEEAYNHYQDVLTIVREVGDRTREADVWFEFGSLYLRWEKHTEALDCFQRSVTMAREVGHRGLEAAALNGLGLTTRAVARPDEALAHHESALDLARGTQDPHEEAHALDGLAHAHHDLGDHAAARQHWQQALAIYTDLGAPEADQVRGKLASQHHSPPTSPSWNP